MTDSTAPAPGKREANRQATLAKIEAAILQVLVEDDPLSLTHDLLAERTGIARRTVYRYFPDRQALMAAVTERIRSLAGANVRFPQNETELVDSLPAVYQGFDRIAPIATVMRSTPMGRQARLGDRKRRQAAYVKATADLVHDLPEADRKIATAMLQFLHTSAWLEMRDQWGFTGAQTARACSWAMRTLITDLRRRKGKPLDG